MCGTAGPGVVSAIRCGFWATVGSGCRRPMLWSGAELDTPACLCLCPQTSTVSAANLLSVTLLHGVPFRTPPTGKRSGPWRKDWCSPKYVKRGSHVQSSVSFLGPVLPACLGGYIQIMVEKGESRTKKTSLATAFQRSCSWASPSQWATSSLLWIQNAHLATSFGRPLLFLSCKGSSSARLVLLIMAPPKPLSFL